MAVASDKVGATAIEANEFPDLSRAYRVAAVPKIVIGGDRVTGELYRIDDEELLPAVDREEGYNFLRRRAVVTLTDGRRARAWIYRYRGPRERAAVIPAGDWRNRWR